MGEQQQQDGDAQRLSSDAAVGAAAATTQAQASTSMSGFDAGACPSSRPPSRYRFVLQRHPYTLANANGLLQGSTDSPLTQHGVQQMEHLCAFLASSSSSSSPIRPLPPLALCTSPLGRCLRLARAISSAVPSCPEPVQLPALEEKDFGQLECTKRGVHAGSKLPKGPNGKKRESGDAFDRRVRRGVSECIKVAIDAAAAVTPPASFSPSSSSSPPPPPLVFLVTHGLWISAFARLFLPGQRVPFAENTGMFVVDIDVDADSQAVAHARLVEANYHPHLQSMARKQRGLSNLADDGKQAKLSSFFGTKRKQRDDDDHDGDPQRHNR